MDAGIVLTTPPPQVSPQADAATDPTGEDASVFAQHLAAEAPPKPTSPRKPATNASDGAPDQAPANDTGPAPTYALSQPTAPVIVRTDGAPAVVDFALTPTADAPLKTAAPDTPVAIAALVAPSPAPQPAPTTTLPAALPTAPAETPAVTPQPAADDAAPLPQQATAPAALPSSLPATPAAPAKPEAPLEPLRAGRGRAAASTEDAPSAGPAKNATAAAPVAQAARPETAQAVAPTAPAAQLQSRAENAPSPQAAADALAPTGEARPAAQAAHPSAVHRPPTIAQTVAQQVIRRFEGQTTSIEVRLDPAELGRVQVKLDVGADSRVTAVVAAENPATLSDLMRSSRELERALESAGLELASGGLSFDLASRGESFGDDSPAGAGSAGGGDAAGDAPAPVTTASRPFGLESWRGVRVDVTV